MEFNHTSVLLWETIENLAIKPDGIYVDGTLGGGGHAYEVCSRLGEKGSIIGIDQDAAAIQAAGERLKDFGEKVTIVRSNYCEMKSRLQELGIDKVDGIVLDLGVSSYQLDTAERGFSYRVDAPLDMRMDRRQEMTARDIVNDYSERASRGYYCGYQSSRRSRSRVLRHCEWRHTPINRKMGRCRICSWLYHCIEDKSTMCIPQHFLLGHL